MDGENRGRESAVTFRVSEREKEMLQRVSAYFGCSDSEAIRYLINGQIAIIDYEKKKRGLFPSEMERHCVLYQDGRDNQVRDHFENIRNRKNVINPYGIHVGVQIENYERFINSGKTFDKSWHILEIADSYEEAQKIADDFCLDTAFDVLGGLYMGIEEKHNKKWGLPDSYYIKLGNDGSTDALYSNDDNTPPIDKDLIKRWNNYCELEPRLKDIERLIRKIKDDGTETSFCANRAWYEGDYKNLIAKYVGYYAETDLAELKTSQAYDDVYQYLYQLLPDCRNCGCL